MCNWTRGAYEGFEKCLELNPHLPDVQARFDVLVTLQNGEKDVPDDYKIKNMLQCGLMATVDEPDILAALKLYSIQS